MVHTARNLARIAITAGRAEPVFAGESAQFRLYLDGRGAFDRPLDPRAPPALGLAAGGRHPANGVAEAVLAAPATQRGWMPLGRVMLETRFPLGLFRAELRRARCALLVYPRPSARRCRRSPARPPPA